MLIKRLILTVGIFGFALGDSKMCGIPPQPIDTETHVCKNGIISKKEITTSPYDPKMCGIPPQPIATKTHMCKNGIITQKEITISLYEKSTSPLQPTTWTTPQDFEKSRGPGNDFLNCTHSLQPGKTKGQKCCGGLTTYNPRFDTCCYKYNRRDAIVHRNKPEKKHVCCSDDVKTVYKRGSRRMPCKHPSLNDKLFRKTSNLTSLTKHCGDFNFAYRIRIHKKFEPQYAGFSVSYNATIERLAWKQSGHKILKQMLIPIDKYTPRLKGKHNNILVVLSNHDFSHDLDFYLDLSVDKEDMVFKGNRKKGKRHLKKYRRQCRK